MISFQAQSDTTIREVIRIITRICMSHEFQALKEELAQMYLDAGQSDFDHVAFADALYTMLVEAEETTLPVKELL